ncbi:RDD family protein [Clostridium sp.]
MNGLNLAYKTKKEIVNARLVAFGIDYSIILVIFLCATRFNSIVERDPFPLFMVSTSVVYFICFETFLGCTLGKFIMGLRVMDQNCNKPNFCKAFVRSLLRIVIFIFPAILLVWIVEYIIAYKSKFKQRLSDKFAGTYVVYEKDLKIFRKNKIENSMNIEEFMEYNNSPRIKVFKDANGNNNLDPKNIIIQFNNNELRINGINGLSVENIFSEVTQGARFTLFYECFSLFIYSKKSPSNIYFIRKGEKNIKYHIGHSLRTLLLGWWGIPWGIVWTISCIKTNFNGGIDMTETVLEALRVGLNKDLKNTEVS